MYHKYQTEALVLGSREVGEADKVCALYTRDFGLVRARVSGVRKETSKMRYALQHYSRANVGLVRGARGWRVAGAVALDTTARTDTAGIRVFARIGELVSRLVPGEEENPYLYEALSQAHTVLMSGGSLTSAAPSLATIEIVCVARILYALGYLSVEALNTTLALRSLGEVGLFTHTAYGLEHLTEAESMREDLLLSINRALNETHL